MLSMAEVAGEKGERQTAQGWLANVLEVTKGANDKPLGEMRRAALLEQARSLVATDNYVAAEKALQAYLSE